MKARHATQEMRCVCGVGAALIGSGLLVNRFTVGLLAADGAISGPVFNVVILIAQAACVTVGLLFLLRPRYRSLADAGLMLISFLLCLGIMEIGLRLYIFGPIGLSPSGMRSMAWLSNRDLIQASPVEEIVYELRPNLDARHAGVSLTTNALGMHDDPVPTVKPAGEFRIAILGDSFSMASGIALEDTWHQQLERRLNEEIPERAVRCLNFAVAGYQLPQYLGVLEHKAAPLDPDMVIVGFCAENDQEATPLAAMRTLLEPRPRPSFIKRLLIVDLLSRMNFAGHQHMDKTPTAEEKAFIDRYFAAFAAYGAKHHVPVVIAFLANLPRPPDAIRSIAEAQGLNFVDAAEGFRVEDLRANSTYHPIDSHPNARANGVFAERLLELLQSRQLLSVAEGVPLTEGGGEGLP